MWLPPLGRGDPLEKGMATHSRVLAWRIPWTKEPGRLQSIGSQRIRHNWSDLTQWLIYFVYLLKEAACSFIAPCYCFPHFFFIYFWSGIYNFFPSTNFEDFFQRGVVVLSLIALSVRLGCLRLFHVSWGRIVLPLTSLLALPLLHPIGFVLCFHCVLFLGIFYFLFDFLSNLLVM